MTDTALIVDDNPINLEALSLLLKKEGFLVVTLRSPQTLPDLLESIEDLRVLFLDIEFPNHDGFKLLPQLKQNPRLGGVPIVAYSVHTSEIHEARRLGFDSFIGKPLNVREFPNQLPRILAGEAIWEAS